MIWPELMELDFIIVELETIVDELTVIRAGIEKLTANETVVNGVYSIEVHMYEEVKRLRAEYDKLFDKYVKTNREVNNG